MIYCALFSQASVICFRFMVHGSKNIFDDTADTVGNVTSVGTVDSRATLAVLG